MMTSGILVMASCSSFGYNEMGEELSPVAARAFERISFARMYEKVDYERRL